MVGERQAHGDDEVVVAAVRERGQVDDGHEPVAEFAAEAGMDVAEVDNLLVDERVLRGIEAVDDDVGTCGVGVVDGELLVTVAVEIAADHGQEPERALLLDVLHDERVVFRGQAVAGSGQRLNLPVREALQLDILSAFAIVAVTRLIGARVDGVRDDELLSAMFERARVVRVVLVFLPVGVEGGRPQGFASHAVELHRGCGERLEAVGDVGAPLVVVGSVHVAHVEVLRIERREAREGIVRRVVVEVGRRDGGVQVEGAVRRGVGEIVLRVRLRRGGCGVGRCGRRSVERRFVRVRAGDERPDGAERA